MSAPPDQPPPTGWNMSPNMPPPTSAGYPSEPPPPYSAGPQGAANAAPYGQTPPPSYTAGPQGAAYAAPPGPMPYETKSGQPPMMHPSMQHPPQAHPGVHYNYMPPVPPGSQVPVTSQPVMVAVVVPDQPADPHSVNFHCKHCKEAVNSNVSTSPSLLAWATGILLCMIGCDLGCCLIPCCIDDCMDKKHSCPKCGNRMDR